MSSLAMRLPHILNPASIAIVCAFFIGMGLWRIYIPFFLLFLFTSFKENDQTGYIRKLFIHKSYSLVIFGFYTIFFSIGAYKNSLYIVHTQFLAILVSSLLLILMIQASKSGKHQIQVLFSFTAGFTFTILLASALSQYINYKLATKLFGYGAVYHPLTGDIINTPGFSSLLALGTIAALFLYYESSSKLAAFLSLITLMICHSQAFFYKGRAYYILTLLGLAGSSFLNKKYLNKKFYICLAALYSVSFAQELLSASSNEPQSPMERGLGSLRFNHWIDGFSKIPFFPSGGFTVNGAIEDTKWFHNLWIDVARVSGWIPLSILLAINYYILKKTIFSNNPYRLYILTAQLVCLAQMFQEVIIEGFASSLILYFALGAAASSSTQNADHK